jgi:integration host factor subunit beta
MLEQMAQFLAEGKRIEIRGFGSFSLHYRPPRTGRNPKTGEAVSLPAKYVPHFKPGKELRDRVNSHLPSVVAGSSSNIIAAG